MEDFCECGSKHQLNTKYVYVGEKALGKLIEQLKASEKENLLILCDEKTQKEAAILKDSLQIKTKVICINKTFSTFSADKIEDFDEDIVVALGKETTISVAKYYAYSLNLEIYIYPVEDFVDYTFSSFCRLYDGIQFAFYKSSEPSQIFVDIKEYSILHTLYIATKYVALFDDILGERVFEQKFCPKMKGFLKTTLNSFLSSPTSLREKQEKTIWTLIRLGQASSFYDDAKFFFGADRAISDFLNIVSKDASYLELEIIALKLIINAYSCFFSEFPYIGSSNLNKMINGIARLAKVPPSSVISRLAPSELICPNEMVTSRFKNNFPYLKGVYSKVLNRIFAIEAGVNHSLNPLKKYSISGEKVEKAFALSPFLSYKPSTIHLLASFGYMDKLI